MINTLALFGVPVFWTVIVVALTAVAVYLFLRNNKDKKAAIDAAVDKFKRENGL